MKIVPDNMYERQKMAIINNAAVMYFTDEGELFLLKMTYEGNKWGTLGGAIDPGESPKEAAIREVKEEIGIDLEKIKCEWKMEFLWKDTMIYVVVGDYFRGIKLSDEHSAYVYASDPLKMDLVSYTKSSCKALLDFLGGQSCQV